MTGRRLKWVPICDDFNRELVALEVERRMKAKDVIRILNEAVLARGSAPDFIAHRFETNPSRMYKKEPVPAFAETGP